MIIHRRLIERNLRSYRPLHHLLQTHVHCRARLQWCLARSGWNHAEWGLTVFSDDSRFQLRPDDPGKRVWRRPWQHNDPAFTIACHTCLQQVVMVLKHFLGQPDPSSIEYIWDMMVRRLHLPENADDLARQLGKMWQEITQETIKLFYPSMPRRVATCKSVIAVEIVLALKRLSKAPEFINCMYRDVAMAVIIPAIYVSAAVFTKGPISRWERETSQRASSFAWESVPVRPISMPPRRNKEKFQQLTEFEHGRIIGLREGGFSYQAIEDPVQRNRLAVLWFTATGVLLSVRQFADVYCTVDCVQECLYSGSPSQQTIDGCV
ncbi:HTH_Tnp_Tc3_2 domain-containing protein [Trichonephila clavipes]|nr:HTH_Tnp_Tc3_2 domain-containing protein [Trichonephila clavipes]